MKVKKVEKYILLTCNDNEGIIFKSEGLSLIELLGLLRLYEQKISLQLLTKISKP